MIQKINQSFTHYEPGRRLGPNLYPPLLETFLQAKQKNTNTTKKRALSKGKSTGVLPSLESFTTTFPSPVMVPCQEVGKR